MMIISFHPLVLLLLTLAIFTILTGRYIQQRVIRFPKGKVVQSIQQPLRATENDVYSDIEPLLSFDWRSEPPVRNAPLKPKYHLTMAIEQIQLSDLIAMDKTYLDRLTIRKQIISTHYDSVIQCNPPCISAVYELYAWLFGTYLPRRHPNIYHLTADCTSLINTATKSSIPLRPIPTDPKVALQIIGENIDTDFLLLLPSSTAGGAADGSPLPIYHLEAFVTCFPTGFSTREKLGLPLSQIHAPVPGYAAKLERSMDRFFARLEVGKCVKRGNWSLTTNADLFAESGNHLYADGKTETDVRRQTEQGLKESLETEVERQQREVVIENCRLRSERQTLFRLPQSRAIVFSFKTYQYTLAEVKQDGYAGRLIEAMEGLREGNVPEMDFYKRGVVWREPVIRYLRD